MRRRKLLATGVAAFTLTSLSGCSRDDGGGGNGDGDGSGGGTEGDGAGGSGPYGMLGPGRADVAALGPVPERDADGG